MRAQPADSRDASMEIFLLGQIDFEACLRLQHRLLYESTGRANGQIALLLCEHPPVITIGRLGSREHVRLSVEQLAVANLDVRWVNRGGGCLLHAPGQLAIYPIVPLDWHRWTVGEFLARLQRGIRATLSELGVAGQGRADSLGVRGRSGQLAWYAAAVKSWTTYFGAYLNVDPELRPFRAIRCDPIAGTPASSLAAERRQPVKMPLVRATIVRHLAAAFDCERYHLYTGHPLAAQVTKTARTKLNSCS